LVRFAIENTGSGNLSINGALDASNFSPTITHSVALINDLGNILEGPLGSIKTDRLYASAGDFSPTGMKDVKLVDPTNTLIAHNDVNFISGRADRKFYYSDINGFDLDFFSVDVQGGVLNTGLINTNHFNGNATTVYLNAQGGAQVNELNGAYIEATNLALGGDAAFNLNSYLLNGVSNIAADVNVNRTSNDLVLKNFYNLFVAFVDVDTSASTTAPMIGIQTGGNVLLDTNPYSTITITQNIQAGLSGGSPTVSITGVVSVSPTVQYLGASGHTITLSASPVPFNGTGYPVALLLT